MVSAEPIKLNKMRKNSTLVIIAGAAGEIGSAYCQKVIESGIDCIGVIRNRAISIKSPLLREIKCDLSSQQSIVESFANVDFSLYKKVIYLHTIGQDKFESRGYPNIIPMETIPVDVYDTNVNTFKYLLRFLVSTINKSNSENGEAHTKIRIAIIAGVGDKHSPFVIESFCEAKFILRQYIRSYIEIYPKIVSGLSINVTSTITESALKVRRFANTEFWLTPLEVVDQSFKKLLSTTSKYSEIDIVKKSPEFFPEYYASNDVLYKKWSKETGIE